MDPADRPSSRIVPWEDLPPHIQAMVARPAPEPPPEPTPPAPTLLSKASSFVGAVATHIADGGRKAPEEVRAARLEACQTCPLHVEPDGCTACGCGVNPALSFVGLDLELKRSWASSRCPDNPPRWGPV